NKLLYYKFPYIKIQRLSTKLWCKNCNKITTYFEQDLRLIYIKALKDLTNILGKEDKALTYAFPRINLPNPNDSYPDHQVRLIKLCEEIEWKGKVHDTPHSIKHDKPVIKMYEEYNDEDYLYCNILQQFPILHHERRTDIKRDWW
ncbi:hypothetical protein LCGC14_2557440, partial [marine sediment metagenome]